MKLVYNEVKAIQSKLHHESKVLPALKRKHKQKNILSMLACALLGFVLTLIVFMAATCRQFIPPNIVFSMFFAKENIVGAICCFVLMEAICFSTFFILHEPAPNWNETYPADAKFHIASQGKTVLKVIPTTYDITLILEDPATHIVTKHEIYIADFKRVDCTNVTETTIDMHEHTTRHPYRPEDDD